MNSTTNYNITSDLTRNQRQHKAFQLTFICASMKKITAEWFMFMPNQFWKKCSVNGKAKQ